MKCHVILRKVFLISVYFCYCVSYHVNDVSVSPVFDKVKAIPESARSMVVDVPNRRFAVPNVTNKLH